MVNIENGYLPETLDEALAIRSAEKVTPYAGGTDLMVEAKENATYVKGANIAGFMKVATAMLEQGVI